MCVGVFARVCIIYTLLQVMKSQSHSHIVEWTLMNSKLAPKAVLMKDCPHTSPVDT